MAQSHPLRFHDVHGENITFSPDRTTASILSLGITYNSGFCFSHRPLEINEQFSFKCFKASQTGEINFGFISHSPSTITVSTLLSNTGPENFDTNGYCIKSIPKEYLKLYIDLSFYYKRNGDVMFCVNGEEKGKFFSGLNTTAPLWALVDVNCIGYVRLNKSSDFCTTRGSVGLAVTSTIRNLGLNDPIASEAGVSESHRFLAGNMLAKQTPSQAGKELDVSENRLVTKLQGTTAIAHVGKTEFGRPQIKQDVKESSTACSSKNNTSSGVGGIDEGPRWRSSRKRPDDLSYVPRITMSTENNVSITSSLLHSSQKYELQESDTILDESDEDPSWRSILMRLDDLKKPISKENNVSVTSSSLHSLQKYELQESDTILDESDEEPRWRSRRKRSVPITSSLLISNNDAGRNLPSSVFSSEKIPSLQKYEFKERFTLFDDSEARLSSANPSPSISVGKTVKPFTSWNKGTVKSIVHETFDTDTLSTDMPQKEPRFRESEGAFTSSLKWSPMKSQSSVLSNKPVLSENPAVSSNTRIGLCAPTALNLQLKEKAAFSASKQANVPITNLELCEKHVNGQCSANRWCDGLHACKFYLLTGTCDFERRGKLCKFGHSLEDDHSLSLLKKHSMEGSPLWSINAYFKNNRTYLLYPIICRFYNTKRGCQKSNTCTGLHICQNIIYSECKFGLRCHYSHNLCDTQTTTVLKQFGFDIHPQTEEKILTELKHGCSLRPHTNNRPGIVHRASSNSSKQPIAKLSLGTDSWQADQGISSDNRNSRERERGRTNDRGRSRSRSRFRGSMGPGEAQQDGNSSEEDIFEIVHSMMRKGAECLDKMEDQGTPKMICSYFLVGRCNYGKCGRIHRSLPYQWQFFDTVNRNWVDFSPRINCRIEENYCNPDWDSCSDHIGNDPKTILFVAYLDSMTVNFTITRALTTSTKVRRLSTRNAISAPDTLPMLTTWCWYWQLDDGVFLNYDSQLSGDESDSQPDPKKLEECFNDDNTEVIQWTLNEFKYEIDFSRMVQKNTRTGKERRIRRRPIHYIDKAMVVAERKKPRKQNPKQNRGQRGLHNSDLPAFWDYSVDTDDNYFRLVPITKAGSTSHEYEKVEAQFVETMSRDLYRITSIERLQNADLYQGFQYYKTKMQRKTSDSVEEKFLFHGTKKEYIDAICLQGFDFRVSGSRTGCLYGHGSYFAKKAAYSRNYTDSCQLFVARVLVGRYAKGESHYKRPPPKDPNKPLEEVFDSCVDDVKNPNIFVVFAIEQAYPEYLVQYQKI